MNEKFVGVHVTLGEGQRGQQVYPRAVSGLL